jgi:hypothetical protein
MSRSNGPLGQPGGQNPQSRQPTLQDPYAGQYQAVPAQGQRVPQHPGQVQPNQGLSNQGQSNQGQQWPQPQDAGQSPYFFAQPPNAAPGYPQGVQGATGGQHGFAPQAPVDPRTGAPTQHYAPAQHNQPQLSSLQRGAPQPAPQGYAQQPAPQAYGQYAADPYAAQSAQQSASARGPAPSQWAAPDPSRPDLSRPDPSRFDLNQFPPQAPTSNNGYGAPQFQAPVFQAPVPAQPLRSQSGRPQGGHLQDGLAQDWQHQAPPTARSSGLQSGAPAQNFPQEPTFGHQLGGHPHGGQQLGGQQLGGQQGYPNEAYADPRQARVHQPIGIPQVNQLANDPNGYHSDDEFDDEEYEDDVEPEGSGRGRKTLMLVLGLVGAIGIGAGCAFAYKTYLGPTNGKPAILKADSAPSKTKPTVPGGKEFTNADRKITARLGEDGAVAADEVSAEPGGPRRVQIIPITPNGAQQAAGPPPRAVPPTIQVPGMSVEFGNTPNRLPQQGLPPVAPQVVQTVPTPPPLSIPQAPARVAVAQVQPPPARAPVQAVPAADPVTPAPAKKIVVAKAAIAKSTDAFSPSGAPVGVGAGSVAAPAAAGSSGFVAVVASGGSPKEAMSAYADLKQKYPEVLGDKPADVREAIVNGKTWHRAVVGPPGSRASVDNLCLQLKASGFLGCWASAY